MRSQRVLIVEDDAAVSRVLARVFDRAGWDASVAPNGQRALEILTDRHVDVMITDISMPKMTGRELCEHLQSVGPYLPTCVLVVTSRTGLEERHWVGALPGVELVEKPVSPKELLRLAEQELDPALESNADERDEAA